MRGLWFVVLLITLVKPARGIPTSAPLISATIYPLYDLARRIAPEARLHLLLPPGADPHHFEPGYRDFRFLFASDLILAAGTEDWLRKNRSLAKKSLFLLPERAEDLHPWLNLDRVSRFVEALSQRLEKLWPERAPLFHRRTKQLLAEIEALREELRALSRCPGKKVVILGHAALGNLLKEAGVREVALAGPHPESEVSPKRLEQLLNLVRRERIPVVFLLDPSFRKYAPLFQKETGAKILKLNPGLPLFEEDRSLSFFELLRKNVENLRQGLCI